MKTFYTAPVRYVVAGRKIYKLTQDQSRLWRDEHGVVWAISDNALSVDTSNGCGVYPFSMPDWKVFRELNRKCSRHDYMYSSSAVQYFKTRLEADEYLEMLVAQDQYFSWLARPFKWLSRVFGASLWENKETRQ